MVAVMLVPAYASCSALHVLLRMQLLLQLQLHVSVLVKEAPNLLARESLYNSSSICTITVGLVSCLVSTCGWQHVLYRYCNGGIDVAGYAAGV
jgi:hypothetical protein